MEVTASSISSSRYWREEVPDVAALQRPASSRLRSVTRVDEKNKSDDYPEIVGTVTLILGKAFGSLEEVAFGAFGAGGGTTLGCFGAFSVGVGKTSSDALKTAQSARPPGPERSPGHERVWISSPCEEASRPLHHQTIRRSPHPPRHPSTLRRSCPRSLLP